MNLSGQLRPTMLCRWSMFYSSQSLKQPKMQASGTHGRGLVSLCWKHMENRDTMAPSSETAAATPGALRAGPPALAPVRNVYLIPMCWWQSGTEGEFSLHRSQIAFSLCEVTSNWTGS